MDDRPTYYGRYEEAVQRSLMTLKAMTYRPTGGIVAAVTTALAGRDWWRAELGLPLLLAARHVVHAAGADARGLHEEAIAWRRVAAARDCRIARTRCRRSMASAGERQLTEWEAAWLRAMKIRSRCASAMRRQSNFNWMSMARWRSRWRERRRPRMNLHAIDGAAGRAHRSSMPGVGSAGRRHMGDARAGASTLCTAR